jgi:hypothetical protein
MFVMFWCMCKTCLYFFLVFRLCRLSTFYFLISGFRWVLNAVGVLFGISPTSVFVVPTFWKPLSVQSSRAKSGYEVCVGTNWIIFFNLKSYNNIYWQHHTLSALNRIPSMSRSQRCSLLLSQTEFLCFSYPLSLLHRQHFMKT